MIRSKPLWLVLISWLIATSAVNEIRAQPPAKEFDLNSDVESSALSDNRSKLDDAFRGLADQIENLSVDYKVFMSGQPEGHGMALHQSPEFMFCRLNTHRCGTLLRFMAREIENQPWQRDPKRVWATVFDGQYQRLLLFNRVLEKSTLKTPEQFPEVLLGSDNYLMGWGIWPLQNFKPPLLSGQYPFSLNDPNWFSECNVTRDILMIGNRKIECWKLVRNGMDTIWLDAEMPTRVHKRAYALAPNSPLFEEIAFSDYRQVSGIWLPFRMDRTLFRSLPNQTTNRPHFRFLLVVQSVLVNDDKIENTELFDEFPGLIVRSDSAEDRTIVGGFEQFQLFIDELRRRHRFSEDAGAVLR